MTGRVCGEVSLPLCLLPLAEFCSQQHSFPSESRSGPPSPESVSETSFSIPSASWELTLTGSMGAPTQIHYQLALRASGTRVNTGPPLQFLVNSQHSNIAVKLLNKCFTSTQRPGNQRRCVQEQLSISVAWRQKGGQGNFRCLQKTSYLAQKEIMTLKYELQERK